MPKRKISSEGAARDAPMRSPTRLSANPASVEVDKEPEKAGRKTNHQSEKCGPKGRGKQREHRLRLVYFFKPTSSPRDSISYRVQC
ncbi:hypothetical protein U0070_015822, partial [Myodes glareolus]